MATSKDGVNRAAWIMEAKGGRIEVGDAPITEPEKGQIRVKVQAAQISPLDSTIYITGIFNLTYPTIFSSMVAGYVDAIGEGVTKVQVGDRVVSGTSIWTSKGEHKYGGMQRFAIVEELEILNIGTRDFSESLTAGIQVGASALFAPTTLSIPRPDLTNTSQNFPPPPPANGKKILIWGGASAMGALSISHCRASGVFTKIISTSSPHNFELLKNRGATDVFDYNDEEETLMKIKALMPIDYYYDCVSQPDSVAALIKLLTPTEPGEEAVKTEIQVLTPPSMHGNPTLPEGITTRFMLFRNGAEENKEFVEWMLKKGGYLEKGLSEGWLEGVEPEKIGGLDAYAEGLKRRALPGLKGVSGQRLIVEPWKV